MDEPTRVNLANYIRSDFWTKIYKQGFYADNPVNHFNRFSDGKQFTWNWTTESGFDGFIDRNNLHQNQLGSCCILATVERFKLVYNDNGTISVKVGQRWVTSDSKLPTGQIRTTGDPDAALIEKVLAIYKQQNFEVKNGYDFVGNGQMLPDEIKPLVDSTTRVYLSFQRVDTFLVSNHAYRVIADTPDTVELFNPWGSVATYYKTQLNGLFC